MTAPSATRPKKIVFVLPSLGGGGAEMHVVRLIDGLDRRRFLPEVLCLRDGGAYRKRLPAEVKVTALCPGFVRSSTASCLWGILPLARQLRRIRPDIVCSFLPHTNGLLLRARRLAGVDFRLVLGVQNHPGIDWNRRSFAARLTAGRRLTLKAYGAADAIVALSQGVATDFAARFPSLAARLHTIYNIGSDEHVLAGARVSLPAHERPPGPLLVACGRLEEQKDYPTLIRATAQLVKEFPSLQLWILGRGAEEEKIKRLAAELGIAGQVRLLGFLANPFQYMAAADVFVLSSRWEGFGNVLVEAMACGTPVVSTRCPFGPEEILHGGEYGELVPVAEPAALATALGGLLRDPAKRRARSELGRRRALDFAPDKIAAAYAAVFEAVLPPVSTLP